MPDITQLYQSEGKEGKYEISVITQTRDLGQKEIKYSILEIGGTWYVFETANKLTSVYAAPSVGLGKSASEVAAGLTSVYAAPSVGLGKSASEVAAGLTSVYSTSVA